MSNVKDAVRAKITKKRLPSDIKQICESKDYHAILPNPDDMTVIWVKFKNAGGFYRNQTHVLEIKITTSENTHDYPFTAPHVKFLTPVFHTNINGPSICLSILKGKSADNPEGWTEIYNLCSVVQAIFLLLECPNTGSPWNKDAAVAWVDCKEGREEAAFVKIVDKYYFEHDYKTAIDSFNKAAGI
jgi:ubiquitin-protein ligase